MEYSPDCDPDNPLGLVGLGELGSELQPMDVVDSVVIRYSAQLGCSGI
jgi:hypothetical protein